MLKVKDLEPILNTKITKVIYENHWTGHTYNSVDENTEVKLILPVDESTIKISINL